MTSIAKHVYIDKLAYIVNEDNNRYCSTIKMKPADVKSSASIEFGLENNHKDFKFKVGDHVRILKYKNIFTKGYSPKQAKEVFGIIKLKILCLGRI